MVQHFLSLGPALLVGAFFLLYVMGQHRSQARARLLTCVVVFAIAIRYLVWRFTDTVLPMDPEEGFAFWWVWFLFVIELMAFADIALFLLIMSRYVDRRPEADRQQAAFEGVCDSDWPRVDVFIPTYNEPLDVLERTIVGALALDYPKEKLKVYVLDDQRRDWLKRFCDEKGAIHVTRPDNSHAKAGNMNNALKIAKGDFVAVFDADFVPYRHFLRRTVPLFSDRTVGIVQTPQHFFNKDPVQSNLSLERVWPDEQRLFFDEMAASRDAWDASFCCGSCSIARRKAVDAIGGFPTESITEDLLTTLAMLNKGYKTRYLNERLSMGLAAENLKGYFVQRQRWCQGGIQTLYLHNGPIRGPGLSLLQRILFLPMSWLVQYFVRLAVLVVPAVYLWTGAAPLFFTGVGDILYYQVPVLLAYFLLMVWLTPTRYLPIVSTAVGVFATFRMLPTVVASLIKPFGKPFRVTPKGSGNEDNEFDGYTFGCIALLTVATALGLVINVVPEWAMIGEGEFSVVAMYWAALNLTVLIIAALICFERSKPLQESFLANEPVTLDIDGHRIVARLATISLEEAVVELPADALAFDAPGVARPAQATFTLSGMEPIGGRVVGIARTRRRKVQRIHIAYALEGAVREAMIVRLYTGSYSQDIGTIDKSAVLGRLWLRAFGRARPA